MRALVVEDDDQKRADILAVLESSFPQIRVDVAHSAAVARSKLLEKPPYDIAILDMTLPQYPDGRVQLDKPTREGEELLEEIDIWRLPTKALILSGFEIFRGAEDEQIPIGDLERRLSRAYPNTFLGWVLYKSGSQDWRNSVMRILRNVTKRQEPVADPEAENA
jgi:CheY-like chemotaxis protein